MSETDGPGVIQGRLGWEAGDISDARVDNLTPHPKNREIYGDTDPADLDDSFIESIREKGVLEPLVITRGKQIISGHRRWAAAKQVGIERVRVRYAEFDDDLAEREALVEFNRQREKTPGQLVNEFDEILEIEQERAKERQGKRTDLENEDGDELLGNVSEKSNGPIEARDKAAEKLNADVSGRTLEKGLEVKGRAEEGDETAQQQWDKLQDGEESFHGAYSAVKEADREQNDDPEPDPDRSDIEPFTSQQTDEWSSPRGLVEPLADALDGFDLDPCSGAEQSPFAAATYTEADDGLGQDWFGDVWINPPYSDMADWTPKAVSEAARDTVDTVVYLCKGDSSTDWWHHAAEHATLITAIDGRLSFGDGDNAAPFPSHVFVFGAAPPALRAALADQGLLLTVGWDDE